MLTRGVVGSLMVLLGGFVVSTLPHSAPALQLDLLVDLRATMTGRMIGLSVVMAGLGLLGAAWLSLCRAVAHPVETGQDPVDLVRWATFLWCAPLLLAPPLFSRDGWSYAAQGMLTHVDASPYAYGPDVLSGPVTEAVDPRWMETVTPYGPLPLAIGDLAAGVTGNPWMLVVVHRLAALVGLALLAWAVPRMARWTGVNPGLATALVVASPLMMANGVGGLHNDLTMVGLMAAGLVVAVERHWALGALLGGLAAAVKAPGGLVCIAIALATLPPAVGMLVRLRRFVGVAVVSLGALVLLGLGWGVGLGWVEALTVPGTVNTPLSMPTVVGGWLDALAALVGLGTDPATFLDLTRLAGNVAALGFAVWVALRWETGSRERAVAAAAAVTGVMILLSPVVHLWYFLWVVPFLAPLRLPRMGSVGLVFVSVVAGIVAPLDSSLHGAYIAIVLGSLFATATVAVLLLTRPSRARVERIAAAPPWLVPAARSTPRTDATPG
ncbi:polyprenol phosphomannose-dependent alpha 1,6 mannosyltransferase MptB [Nocardioides zeae]|uniref:Polyprenol phosphomannose-dependent alpha 1,6 mannosyltransferase MptB n=1 Tax=Nocardioides imazamoxiresistens TaxID=3231893 RepID=A0ABU3PS78_9ACTN|nr:polyprenol phosphomannose-dependent alpha 1,6 mannosyltransferase MptB [Nocardioides zeae]MDT9592072.1 polyprenol phosphomannose-dependent alpha 1,6 mannosyltransferase MptB [Nocardioides zeae]